MTTQHIETLIIGAGQAGLATAYHLQRLGRPCLVVDRNERIGDNWRQQWDTLKLYSPAKYDGLPGLAFPAPPWSYPGKDDVADYLEQYAIHADLPVRMSTSIDRLVAAPGRRLRRGPGRGHHHLRQRRRGHRQLRSHAERAGVRGRARSRRSGSCTPASTAARPSSATGRSSSSAPLTRAATSPTRRRRTCPRPSSAATRGRSRSGGTRVRSGSCSP